MAIKLRINGREEILDERTSITDVLQKMQVNAQHVVVERNGAIIDKSLYDNTFLEAADEVEIVRYMGGG